MNLAEAADVLGVKDLSTQSPADLQRIYRDRARTAHPDGGGSAEAFNRLRVAYVLALSEAEAAGIPHFIVGHVGDGNFHVAYLIDPASQEERDTAERLNHQLVQRAIAAGGTCTGEHGIGLHKQGFLIDEAGAGAVAMMREIKRALDPHNIMNPGKIFSW